MFKRRLCPEARNLKKEALREKRENQKYQARMTRIMKDLVDIIDNVPVSCRKVPQKHGAPMEVEVKFYELSKRLVRALNNVTPKEFQDMWGEHSPVYTFVRCNLDDAENIVAITVSPFPLEVNN